MNTQHPNIRIPLPIEQISRICRKHGVAELAVFGSALREDFGPASDVDFLVTFSSADLGPWMSKLTSFQDELTAVLRRPADVVPKSSLKWVIRDRVLQEAQVVYAQ